MKKYIEKIREEKGFTLAELLIVVAIIAVLVAIAIPIFTSQLEKSAEATDAANIRSAYAELSTAYISNPAAASSNAIELKQTKDGWNNDVALPDGISESGTPGKDKSATVSISADGDVTVTYA